nr:uncharacterized protein LOC113820010 [Penaeus vannamei]
MRKDNRTQLRSFWQSLPTRQNQILFPEEVGFFVKEAAEDDAQDALPSTETEDTESGPDVEDQKDDDLTEELVNKILSESLGAEMTRGADAKTEIGEGSAAKIVVDVGQAEKDNGMKNIGNKDKISDPRVKGSIEEELYKGNNKESNTDDTKHSLNKDITSPSDNVKDLDEEEDYSKDLYKKDDIKAALRKKYYHSILKNSALRTVTDTQTEHTGLDAQTDQTDHKDTNIPGDNKSTNTQTGHVGTSMEDGSTQERAPDSDFFIVKKMIDYGDMYQILKDNEEAIRQYNAAVRLTPSMCTFGEDC